MKKTYIIPTVKTIMLDAEESMAQVLNSSNFDELNDGVVDGGTKNDFSNRRSIWGDPE